MPVLHPPVLLSCGDALERVLLKQLHNILSLLNVCVLDVVCKANNKSYILPSEIRHNCCYL